MQVVPQPFPGPAAGQSQAQQDVDAFMRPRPPSGALKTKLCTKFMTGVGCPYGPNCNFAHGEEDLRETQIVMDPEVLAQRKTRLCNKYFTIGGCPYGDRCNFAHEMKEGVQPPVPIRNVDGEGAPLPMLPMESSGASSTAVVAAAAAAGGILMPFNFKTKICNKWQQGACPFGAKCHFAHGNTELKARQPLPGGDVPGAPKGEWPDGVRALKNMASAPTIYMPPQAAALAAVAAAAAAREYAYPANPYGDYIPDEELIPQPQPQPDPVLRIEQAPHNGEPPPASHPPPPAGQPPPHILQQQQQQYPSMGPPAFNDNHNMYTQGSGPPPPAGMPPSYHPPPPPGRPVGAGPPPPAPGGGYKANICHTFIQNGFCPYGDTCYDAHGESELRR